MKKIIKKIITVVITIEAKLVLLRYKPKIVAISGTVGKTSAKDMIHQVLSTKLKVRKTKKSLNSEFGIPLTILGFESGWNNPRVWLKIIFLGLVRIIHTKDYPEWLVLETGIDRPGDMDKIAKFLKPDIAVITAFGSIPAHVEYFATPEDVMVEEAKLMHHIKPEGALIINADDSDILKLKSKSTVRTYTYGFLNEESDIQASNYSINYENDKPSGISFKVNYEGNVIPITINKVLGEQYIYPSLAAIVVGKILDISPISSGPAISEFVPAPGRMNLIPGKNNSVIIDDTYNASPLAMQKALESLISVKIFGKKIVILGDMLEIGRFSHVAHERIGELVAKKKIDFLITVGLRAETVAEVAHAKGMAKKRIFIFKKSVDAIEAAEYLQSENPGSLILVKGSQGIRMEKIVKELIENPEKAGTLLVRQEKEWLNK
jgi:UDP-N-acetylmuramoyl-tripeptide--D-alanyl-D-alanine ligase